jgi:hypothetical protein
MSANQAATLSSQETAVLSLGVAFLCVLYTAAVFLCGRLCCIDDVRKFPYESEMRRRQQRVSGVALNVPLTQLDIEDNSSEDDVLSPSN